MARKLQSVTKRKNIVFKRPENIEYFRPIADRDAIERINNDEYDDYLSNAPCWRKIRIGKCKYISWYKRLAENPLTFDDISIDEINEYITEWQGQYLNGNKFVAIGRSSCARIFNDAETGNPVEPPIITTRYPGTESYWVCKDNEDCKETVYIAVLKSAKNEYIKVGQAENGFSAREANYADCSKSERARLASTERYLKELMMTTGCEIEWYACMLPTNPKTLVGDAYTIYKNPLAAGNFEAWVRNAIQNKFNKKFIENMY